MVLCDSVSEQWSDNVAFIRRLKVTDLKSRKKKVLIQNFKRTLSKKEKKEKRREKEAVRQASDKDDRPFP